MKFIKAIVILSCIIYSLQIKKVGNKLESFRKAERFETRKDNEESREKNH